ncbi:hypothetical protein KSS87_005896 [Heliosperma pusillum]|nr:hypothetical protein KSS87_005896 [Heliosperma pusillum]
MTICQICGDEGYLKLLTHCVQCQNVAAHRYCVLNPSIFEETIKWSCEFCDPGKTKPTTPSRKGQDLNSTVQQAVLRKTDQTKLGNNLRLPESEKPNNGQKETAKETADIFVLDQKNKDNSSKRKQVKRSDDAKEEKINYDNGIEKESCQAVQVKEQSLTNMRQSNTNGHLQVDLGNIVCALLANVEDGVIKGDTKLVKRQSVTRSLLSKKGDGATSLDKSSCKVSSKQMEESHTSKSQSNTKLAHPVEDRESEVEETIAEFVKRKQAKQIVGVKNTKQLNYNNGVMKDSSEVGQVKEKNIKNVSQSAANSHQQVNIGKNVGPLLSNVEETITESTCKAGHSIQRGTELVNQQELTSCLVAKKSDAETSLDKSSCEVSFKQMEGLHINRRQSDAKMADHADDRKSEGKEIAAESVKRKKVNPLVDVKKIKIKQSNYDNGVKKGSSEADQIKEQSVKNMSLSDTNGHRQVNPGKNGGSLSSNVKDNVNTESKCRAGHSIQGGTKSVNQQKRTSCLVAKKSDGETSLDKSSCDVSSKQTEGLHINKSQSDAELAVHAENRKSEGKEIAAEFVKRKQLKPLVDVKKIKKIEQSNYDNGVKKGGFEADQVQEQSVKNVSMSDTKGNRQVNLGKNAGPLSSKVKDNAITGSTCKAGNCIQGGTKLLERKKLTSCLVPKKGDGASSLDKSSCQVSSKQMKEVQMNGSQPNAEEADYANKKKSESEKIKAEFVLERRVPRKKRKFIIEMEYSDEDPVFVVAKHSQLVANVGQDHWSTSEALSKLSDDGLAQLSSIESVPPQPSPMMVDERGLTLESSVVFDNRSPAQTLNSIHHVPAQPLMDVAWRGCCSITNNEYPMSLVLGAHLSNKAHENVQVAVRELPKSLEFDWVSKKYAWPKTFESSPPTADVIGVYFFPIDERSEKLYDYLVDRMVEHSLVLKALLNYVELLVFCSLELPGEERSLRRKYYLWGVFKPRKDFAIPNNPSNVHISETDSIYQQKDLSTLTYPPYRSTSSFSETHVRHEAFAESVESTLPIAKSPYHAHDKQGHGINNSTPRTFSNTHFRQDVMVESLELTQPYTEPHSQSLDKQGCDIHDGDNRLFHRPQDHERRNRSEYVKHAERNHKYHKNDDRWNRQSRKRKDRDWKSSRYRSERPYYRSRSNYR